MYLLCIASFGFTQNSPDPDTEGNSDEETEMIASWDIHPLPEGTPVGYYEPLSSEELEIKQLDEDIPFIMAVKRFNGIKKIQYGNVFLFDSPEEVRMITQMVEAIVQDTRYVDLVMGAKVEQAGLEMREIMDSGACEERDCIQLFADKVNANMVIDGDIELERGVYTVKVEMYDLRRGDIALVGSVSITIESLDAGVIQQRLEQALTETQFFPDWMRTEEQKYAKLQIRALRELGDAGLNAKVYINEEFVGMTPYYNPRVPLGRYKIRVVRGYADVKRVLDLNSSTRYIVGLRMITPKGTLAIDSVPRDAIVYLNNQYVGKTPIDLEGKKYGFYKIKIVKNWYETLEIEVELTSEKKTVIEPLLETGLLKIRGVPPDAQIFLLNGDRRLRIMGNTEVNLIADEWRVLVRSEQFQDFKAKITIPSRETFFFNPPLKPKEEVIADCTDRLEGKRALNRMFVIISGVLAAGSIAFSGIMISGAMQAKDAAERSFDRYLIERDQTLMQQYYKESQDSIAEHNKKLYISYGGFGGALLLAVFGAYWVVSMPEMDDWEVVDCHNLNIAFGPDPVWGGWSGGLSYTFRF